ncbi:MAG: hypothetical protein GEU93_10440 [Propionibacteriales bacterium]|nr:hypothetical protein [Propionibacteriales bacterium]
MIEPALEALSLTLRPDTLIFLVLGVLLGIVVGILPGLGGVVGLSVLLPFVYGMEPAQGMAMMLGLAAVTNTSDVFPSALMGVPGASSAQATILDGYPLTRQGKGLTVLAASFSASLAGGLIGAFVLYFCIFAARPIILTFGSPELFMLILLGLSMVGVLSRGATRAGLLAAFIGLILGAVGAAPTAPEYRFTFDQLYLFDGIPLAVLALGLFAVPEIVDLLVEGGSIAERGELRGSRKEGILAVWTHRWLVVRSAIVGTFIGFLPGLGSSVGHWMAYGLASQTRKDNKFGKGDIRGVIAPDSASNAGDGGALVPTLLFGIPGSGSFAVLLGGMTLLGLQPGPSMLNDDLPLVVSTVWTLTLANVLATLVCLGASMYVVKLTQVPAQKLAPFVLVIIVVAAYQSSRHWGDILTLLVLGTIGWIMKQLNWPRAPLLVGFVLSVPAERYLWTSTATFGASWLTDPLVIVIGVVIAIVLLSGTMLQRKMEETTQVASRVEEPRSSGGAST